MPSSSAPHSRQYRLLQAVFAACILVGLAIALYPFWPLVTYSLAPPHVSDAAPASGAPAALGTLPAFAAEQNVLIIPKIGVRIPVVEGDSKAALSRGAWRIPGTSDDPLRGNMVLSAHRFRYRPPLATTFYLLDKIAPGDTFTLSWQGRPYVYRVAQTFVVEPTATEILQPTPAPVVTLFTCTPLFSTAQRLVVVGELTTPQAPEATQ